MSTHAAGLEGRLVHLGIGNFARAHTLLATQRAGGWGVSVFTGRSAAMADALNAQGGRYGLVVRGPEEDDVEIIDVIDEAFAADDLAALQRLVADPLTAVVTLTITEKGYAAGTDPATSAPARLALALQARREAGVEEPIALVACDNLTGNGEVLREAVLAGLDEDQRAWFEDHVDVVSTMVDRITPAADPGAGDLVLERTGLADQVPVVTEPFSEWVIEDGFRGRRPAWEKAEGVQIVPDVSIHELRKLRLLNGAHTLMAYAGQVAGVERVDEAIAHPEVRALVEALWDEARSTLDLPAAVLAADTPPPGPRGRRPRPGHRPGRITALTGPSGAGKTTAVQVLLGLLEPEQGCAEVIAADGTAKLPVRALPVIAELGGPDKAPGEVSAVAAWTAWVTDRVRAGQEVADPQAEAIAAAAGLEDDRERVAALVALLPGATEDLPAAVRAEESRLPRP